jgi:putative oxidoreductase
MVSKHDSITNTGLLVLRSAALLLALTFGREKLFGYVQLIYLREPLATSGLGPLIAKMGFPFPGLLGLLVALIESVGSLFLAIGFFSRLAAACLVLSMAGAFYVSVRLGEDSLRAALYFIIFATLMITGPGRFSVSGFLNERRKSNAAASIE